MKRTNKRELNLNRSSHINYNLNQISTGCSPCSNEALKIKKQVNGRSLNEIKINEIKKIVRSIFKRKKYDKE